MMVNQNQILHYLSENKQHISRKYHLKKLGIFGSYARNEQTSESDLDLLIEFEDNTPDLMDKKEFLRKEIQSVFEIPVDICREKYIKPIFRQHILTDAIYV
jgi:predicted nucleotidyltransferase